VCSLVVARWRGGALRPAPVRFWVGGAFRQRGDNLGGTTHRADQNLLGVRFIARTPTRFVPAVEAEAAAEPDTGH
jgi:hypothetical protein